jgi:ABC-type molybdate transport system substrate-binding protein
MTTPIVAVGAVKHALTRLLAMGDLPPAEITFFTAGGARDAVLSGAACGLVFTSAPAMAALVAAARVLPPAKIIGRTGLGFAVPDGADELDTTDLRAALLGAARIAMADPASGATAGTHFQAVLDQLGLATELAPRITRHANGMLAVAEVAAGRADLGVSQVTEIVPTDGVALGGMLPEALQLWTAYEAALTPAAGDGARVWFNALAGDIARETFIGTGFVP